MAPETPSPAQTITKPLTYVVMTDLGLGQNKIIRKNMEYAVQVTFIDFNPEKYGPKTVMVDGKVAIKLSGRVYIEV